MKFTEILKSLNESATLPEQKLAEYNGMFRPMKTSEPVTEAPENDGDMDESIIDEALGGGSHAVSEEGLRVANAIFSKPNVSSSGVKSFESDNFNPEEYETYFAWQEMPDDSKASQDEARYTMNRARNLSDKRVVREFIWDTRDDNDMHPAEGGRYFYYVIFLENKREDEYDESMYDMTSFDDTHNFL